MRYAAMRMRYAAMRDNGQSRTHPPMHMHVAGASHLRQTGMWRGDLSAVCGFCF
jgi:hypothetical protein